MNINDEKSDDDSKDKKEIKLWYYIEIKRKDNGERMNGEYTYRKEWE